ncbi:uncharacterized protein LOC5511749 isoform X2 [Nematostella vectensis]|uniref:uncharacterized protein LOC5511749 isoform X2 n=1 Tax=Nematostella vectensis TaxID=45351 RepID=UPI0013902B7F|nr:uncharacterized protein LOC5511749 isoform X2 [Nematostella vectensis]
MCVRQMGFDDLKQLDCINGEEERTEAGSLRNRTTFLVCPKMSLRYPVLLAVLISLARGLALESDNSNTIQRDDYFKQGIFHKMKKEEEKETELHQCELLNKTAKSTVSGDFLCKPGFAFYGTGDKVASICERSPCGGDDICLPLANTCLNYTCVEWAEFNSSLFKYNSTPSTWLEAKTACNSHGGHLVSIASEQENNFLYEKILKFRCADCFSPDRLTAKWELDGTDSGITTYGNARYQVVDGKTALYLDGTSGSYATIPDVDFRKTRFTISLWMRPMTPMPTCAHFLADWSNPFQFRFTLHENGNIGLQIRNTAGQDMLYMSSNRGLNLNTWNHVIITWKREEKMMKIFINGTEAGSQASTLSNVDFMYNTHSVYDIGLKRDSMNCYMHAHVASLMIIHRFFLTNETTWLFHSGADYKKIHGAWIGLNDREVEGTMVWSDGTPLTYSVLDNNDNSYHHGCTTLGSQGGSMNWLLNHCMIKMPFICEKPMN